MINRVNREVVKKNYTAWKYNINLNCKTIYIYIYLYVVHTNNKQLYLQRCGVLVLDDKILQKDKRLCVQK
jgi:hypothetical protein